LKIDLKYDVNDSKMVDFHELEMERAKRERAETELLALQKKYQMVIAENAILKGTELASSVGVNRTPKRYQQNKNKNKNKNKTRVPTKILLPC